MKHFQFLYTAYPKGGEEDTPICAVHVIEFLQKIIEYDKARGISVTFIIMDNANIHRAKVVKQFAKEHQDKLKIMFQPVYSPELNPQENIWNWLKQHLSQPFACKTVLELLDKIQDFQQKVNSMPDEIKNWAHARI